MRYFKDNNNEVFGYEETQTPKDGLVEITLDEVTTINNTKQVEAFNSLNYAEKRASEYPPMEDYLDAIVKNDTVAQQEYIDKCLAVKAKYPKE